MCIEKTQNIQCTAWSFSSLLLNAAKASIPFGRLGCLPKAWRCEEVELAVMNRRRAHSEAHHSETHRLAYVKVSRRASLVIPAQSLVPFSTFSTLLLARRVLPATQNFLTPNPPKTLPTPAPLTSVHTFLSKLPASFVVLSMVSWTTYARTNAPTHHFIAHSAPPSPPRNSHVTIEISKLSTSIASVSD